MPRLIKRSLQIALDLLVLSVAYWLAFLFRFEFRLPQSIVELFLIDWPVVVLIQYCFLALFGVPRMAWRYMSMHDVVRVMIAVSASTIVLAILRLGLPSMTTSSAVYIPLGVLAMDFALVFLGLVGIRAAWRFHGESRDVRTRVSDGTGGDRRRVLLIGAGEAGVMVLREIARRPDLRLKPAGFLDDNPLKIGTSIAGLPVLGATTELAEIAARLGIERVLITIANASGAEIRRITQMCLEAKLETKIIPGVYEIVGGNVNLSRIREVAIEDLLGRDPVQLDEDVVGDSISDRVVLVTGAGGSIGSELCRQICRFQPRRLILVERFENALFEIHRELLATYPEVSIEPVIGDVCDVARMTHVFERHKPELVVHAAAHKHVPMMEWNPGEAVKNNIGGTRNIGDLAHKFGVARFVLVSTDKAVNPTSVMGATKRVAEIYLQALSQRSTTRFVTVRFGNVLGSNGSVIPIFREQIARGGPVTVTHPDMRRYFMTIPEASQLVLQAGAMGRGGEIFILDMGEPVRIVDLARDLIKLSGLRPDEDIEIQFAGVRPGEKLVEELSTLAEHAEKTTHPKVFTGRIKAHEWQAVTSAVDGLLDLARVGSERVRATLETLVPEYRPEGAPAVPADQPVAPVVAVIEPRAPRSSLVGSQSAPSWPIVSAE
ncbi:MAG: nucleoside-diphosphate sugar epimerase/dehydratase [Kofleriaceae bacterium]